MTNVTRYNIKTDPTELHNVAGSNPGLFQTLLDRVDHAQATVSVAGVTGHTTPGSRTRGSTWRCAVLCTLDVARRNSSLHLPVCVCVVVAAVAVAWPNPHRSRPTPMPHFPAPAPRRKPTATPRAAQFTQRIHSALTQSSGCAPFYARLQPGPGIRPCAATRTNGRVPPPRMGTKGTGARSSQAPDASTCDEEGQRRRGKGDYDPPQP